jgi:hypothetical protein
VSDLKISKQQGATGGAGESVDQTTTFQRKDGTYQTPNVVNGVQTLNGGTNTSPSVPVISSPGFAVGTASQLSDTTRDYMVYITIGTPGTGMTLAIGPTSTPANTIHSSSTPTAGMQFAFRLPAGWYAEVAGSSTTIANQIAIGC